MSAESFSIAKAAKYTGQKVLLQGWVRHIRSSGSLFFLEMRDGTGILQVVVAKDDVKAEIQKIQRQGIDHITRLSVSGVRKDTHRIVPADSRHLEGGAARTRGL